MVTLLLLLLLFVSTCCVLYFFYTRTQRLFVRIVYMEGPAGAPLGAGIDWSPEWFFSFFLSSQYIRLCSAFVTCLFPFSFSPVFCSPPSSFTSSSSNTTVPYSCCYPTLFLSNTIYASCKGIYVNLFQNYILFLRSFLFAWFFSSWSRMCVHVISPFFNIFL